MFKTAEAVSPKHPDKVADRIADAILDRCLMQDPDTRSAIEVMAGHGIVTITGELTTKAYVNISDITKSIVGDKIGVQTNIVMQSPEIARGVDNGGAGDQGIMVGYACSENEEYIPLELYYARSLCKFIYAKYPEDGKTQITIDDNGKITKIVASFCNINADDLKEIIIGTNGWLSMRLHPEARDYELFCNPAGDWCVGGIDADTGLTGRKLICDNYGPQIPIGGGATSGKDCTKVDRSGAYMARRMALFYLKYFDAKEICVKLAYAIGVIKPVMATVNVTYKDNFVTDIDLLENFESVIKSWDLTPAGIIKELDLKKPIYEKLAEWGNYGNGYKWDLIE